MVHASEAAPSMAHSHLAAGSAFAEPHNVGGSRSSSKNGGATTVEDDFAFIEKLLDNLQGDGEASHIAAEAALNTPSESSAHRLGEISDLIDSFPRPAAGEPSDESWRSLLSNFCESGDETIVDSLLDKFLGSNSDAANLLDAIDRGVPAMRHAPPTKHEKKNAHLQLQLDHVTRGERLDSWEGLLASARGILHSARTLSARSAHSAHSHSSHAAAPPEALVDHACPAVGSATQLQIPAEDGCHDNVDGEPDSLSSQGSPTNAAVISAEEELRSRLACIDDPEIMRDFMKKFLLGIRRRCMNEQRAMEAHQGGNNGSEASDGTDETDDEDSGDETPSVWTCRSVGTCSVEPSVIE